jgi:nucleoside-diphosphate-sugar epimerase
LPRSSKSLCWVKGDILEVDAKWDKWQAMYEGLSSVDAFLHGAASTRLHMNAEGDPLKTNVEGARALLRLNRRCPRKVHIVSTAYVCGRTRGGRL